MEGLRVEPRRLQRFAGQLMEAAGGSGEQLDGDGGFGQHTARLAMEPAAQPGVVPPWRGSDPLPPEPDERPGDARGPAQSVEQHVGGGGEAVG